MNRRDRKVKRLTLLRAQASYYRYRFRRRITTWLQYVRSPDERNALHLYGDIASFGIANGILGTFTSVFAIRLGASETLIGLLSSLPALINVVWQVPSARIVERAKQTRTVTVRSLFLQRIAYLLIALMPFFLIRYRAEAIVALITLAALPGALGSVAFTTLFADSVPADKRANVVSIRNMFLSLTSMLSVLLAGKLLDTILFPYNYQLFFAIAFVASMFSLHHVRQVEPLRERRARKQAPRPKSRVPLKTRLRRTWQAIVAEREFLNYAAGSFAFNWGLYFPMALYSIYRVRDLGASDTWLGLLSTTMSAVQTVMFLVWGRVMKQRGNRWLLLVSAFGLAGFPLFTGLCTRVEPLLLVAILGGFFSAGYSIANFDCFMSACPSERLPTYTAVYNTLANITAFIGPLLGTTVAGWTGVRYALMLGGGLRLLGVLVMSRLPFGSGPPPGSSVGPGPRLGGYLARVKRKRQRRKRTIS